MWFVFYVMVGLTGFVMCGCVYVWYFLKCGLCVLVLLCMGVCMCGFRKMWVCVCVGFVICGCAYVWVL